MTWFAILGVIGLLVIAEYYALKRAFDRGHREGCEFAYLEGYEAGRSAAERWVEDLEVGVQEEREKMWREE